MTDEKKDKEDKIEDIKKAKQPETVKVGNAVEAGQAEEKNQIDNKKIENNDKSVKPTEEKNKKEQVDPEEVEKRFDNDDLPEEIKKKLEKKKIERARKKQARRKNKKESKIVKKGRAYIKATYNNTVVTLTDLNGNVISWASAGIAGFKGPKKATPYAAQIITKIACLKAKEEFGLEEVDVFIKGVGTGRESAVRALNANGLIIDLIKDITPIPHNGCRARRSRRV